MKYLNSETNKTEELGVELIAARAQLEDAQAQLIEAQETIKAMIELIGQYTAKIAQLEILLIRRKNS